MAQRITSWCVFLGWQKTVCSLVLLLCFAQSALAQPFYFGNNRPRTTTAVTIGVTAIDFQFDGENAPARVLNFDSPAYGVTYSRSNIFGSIAFGRQNSSDSTTNDLSLVDFTLALWGEVFFSEAATSADQRIFVPIKLFSNYRRVQPSGMDLLEEFNITTLGLGLGLGYYGAIGEHVLIELLSTPVLGYAVQSFGDASGFAQLWDNDLQLHFGSVFDKIGISIGYTLRLTRWNINTSGIFANLSDDLYDYKDTRQTFSIGINW